MEQRDKGLIWGLLETASDADEGVKRAVSSSLITTGCQHPVLVLSSMHRFLDNPQTAPQAPIQTILYNAAEGIMKECGKRIEDLSIITVWTNDSKQLLIQPYVSVDLQQAASSLLVTMGCCTPHTKLVVNTLLDTIKLNSAPSLPILESLAEMAATNPDDISSYFADLLSKLLPCLPSIKHDNIRLSVAVLMAKFAEAQIEAFASKESTISDDHLQQNCASVYETLLSWLKNSATLTKNEIVKACGHFSYLLSCSALEEVCGATISAILSHYKRNPNTFVLTFSLALICDAVIKKDIADCLRSQLDLMLSTLFSQACISPNYGEPLTVKNYCEVLRCYEILGRKFAESVLAQILHRLENASHVQRVGALLVTRHFINSHSLEAEHYSKLIATLQPLLSDPNSKVVKSITQVIVALCHNFHLNSENGPVFVGYLVQHSAGGSLRSPDRRTSLSEVGDEPVGDTCCRALNLLATTIPSAIPILWPHLLQYVNNPDYAESLPTILSCLSYMSNLQHTQPTKGSTIFKKLPPESSAPAIITRLLVLCCAPSKHSIGVHSLELLGGLASHLSPSLVDAWSEHLPQLKANYMKLCASATEPISIQLWQDSLRDLLAITIQEVNSDIFRSSLISAQVEQLEQHDKNQAYKSFLMTLVGVTLKHCNNTNLIATTLHTLYSLTNHKSSAEQESFSTAVGMCASTHMPTVLMKIDGWLKAIDGSKRSLSLMSILKQQDSRSEEYVLVRSSIVQCLGEIASLSSPVVVGSQVDGPIMLHLLNIMNNNKNDLVADVVLQTTSKLCKSLLQLPGFKLRQRPIFITHIINSMKQDNISANSLALCLQAMRDLVALEPELNIDERTTVLQASLSCTFTKLLSSPNDVTLNRCYSQLNVLLRTVIQHDTNPATLDDVTTLLHHWTLAVADVVRIRAVDLLHSSFCTYLQYLVIDHVSPTSFNQTCQLLSILTPRFADPCPEIRVQSVTCAILILRIAGRYMGESPEYTDEHLECLKTVEGLVGLAEDAGLERHLSAIAEALSNKLNFSNLRLYLSLMVCGLQDKVEKSACGSAQILSVILALRGHQLHQYVKEILDCVMSRLEKVSDDLTRQFAVEALFNLSRHNVTTLVNAILERPIPYEKGVAETLSRLGCDADICAQIVTHFIHILERTQPTTVQKTATEDSVSIATLPTLAVICAMKHLFAYLSKTAQRPSDICNRFIVGEDKARQVVIERFANLCALLMLSFGSYIDAMAPLHQTQKSNSKNAFIPNRDATSLIPSKCALKTMLALVCVGGCHELEESLTIDLHNNGDTFHFFLHTISTITKLLAGEAPEQISSLVAYLDTHHSHQMQRVTVTAVFAELVAAKCCGDYELLEILTQSLLSRLTDESADVRRLAIRGLAHFAQLQSDQFNDKLSEILTALVSATDLRQEGDNGQEGEVALESMKGLSSLLQSLRKEDVSHHASTLFIRIRVFMEQRDELRTAAVDVMRGLALSVGDSDEFNEHCHLHLLSAVIHLQDPYAPMVESCKGALRAMAPHLNSSLLHDLFTSKLRPNQPLDYGIFVSELAKHLPSVLGDKIAVFVRAATTYFRHTGPNIRKSAVLLIGNLIYHYGESLENALLQNACSGLHNLMKDSDATVRSTAALVVPFLFKHEKFL